MRRVRVIALLAVPAIVAAGLSSVGVAPAQTLPTVTVATQTVGNSGGTSPPVPNCQTQVAPLIDTVFLITLSAPSPEPMDVTLSWGGTAVVGVDYANHPGSVTIPASTATLAVPAAINASAGGKTITLTVAAGPGYSVGTPATATAAVAVPLFPLICIFNAPIPNPPIAANPNFTG